MINSQLTLFETDDFSLLEQDKDRLLVAHRSALTVKAYRHGWRLFSQWCEHFNRVSLPTSPRTLELWLLSMLRANLSVATVEARLAAVVAAHKDAGFDSPKDVEVQKLMSGARRLNRTPPKCKSAVTVDQLRQMALNFDAAEPSGARDRAVLVFGFSTGLRRSNVSLMDRQDVEIGVEGLRVQVRREKNDQEGVGRVIGVGRGDHEATCPARTLSAWLRFRGDVEGPLFCQVSRAERVFLRRMSSEAISQVVKRGVKSLSLDPARYGAHSLRAGFVTAAAEAGASPLVIMQRTGHKSFDTLQMYFRPTRLFAADPLAGLL